MKMFDVIFRTICAVVAIFAGLMLFGVIDNRPIVWFLPVFSLLLLLAWFFTRRAKS